MPVATRIDRPEPDHETPEQLSRTLDEWRARIDQLMVQLDLASLDFRDELHKRVDINEDAYRAARSSFSDKRDVTTNMHSVHEGTEKLLRDLRQVYDAAIAVLRRGSEG